MNENNLFDLLKKELENDLNYLKKEKEEEKEKYRLGRVSDLEKIKELTKLIEEKGLELIKIGKDIEKAVEEKHEKNKSEIIQMLENKLLESGKEWENEILDKMDKKLEKVEKKQEGKIKELEKKLRTFYYWLFSIALVLKLLIIGGIFFALRSSSGK